MKKVIETTLSDEIIVWTDSDGDHDVTHTPKLHEISLSESEGWKIGQKVIVIIESSESYTKREMNCIKCSDYKYCTINVITGLSPEAIEDFCKTNHPDLYKLKEQE